MFVAAYGPTGSVAWVRHLDSVNQSGQAPIVVRSASISAVKTGAVYVTGQFGGGVTFGSQTLYGNDEMFLVKYDRQGVPQWMRRATGTGAFGLSVASLANGSVYVTGAFSSSISLSGPTLTGTLNTINTFAAKYSASGAATWVRGSFGTGSTSSSIVFSLGRSVAVREGCAVALTGGFTEAWSFDSASLTSAGDEDMFLMSLKP